MISAHSDFSSSKMSATVKDTKQMVIGAVL